MAALESQSLELPEEVLKSRRNLILISFWTFAVLLLAPQITELRVAGVEIKFLGNNKIQYLLTAAILLEL